jgi:uncharacterized protein
MPNHGPMACPVDGATLVMSDRQGIEIDYCPTCRGVWLDRGELDKIIERSGDRDDDRSRAAVPPQPGYGHGKPYYKKKKHWLQDIFD